MKKFLKAFLYSNNKPQPVYFWVTVFLGLTVAMIILRMSAKRNDLLHISDTLILGMAGFVLSWITVYTWFQNKNGSGSNKGGSDEPK